MRALKGRPTGACSPWIATVAATLAATLSAKKGTFSRKREIFARKELRTRASPDSDFGFVAGPPGAAEAGPPACQIQRRSGQMSSRSNRQGTVTNIALLIRPQVKKRSVRA